MDGSGHCILWWRTSGKCMPFFFVIYFDRCIISEIKCCLYVFPFSLYLCLFIWMTRTADNRFTCWKRTGVGQREKKDNIYQYIWPSVLEFSMKEKKKDQGVQKFYHRYWNDLSFAYIYNTCFTHWTKYLTRKRLSFLVFRCLLLSSY
jgi:hypothetical protein